MPLYKKYLKFIKKDYNDELGPTDNKLENYLSNTSSKHVEKFIEQNKDYLISY